MHIHFGLYYVMRCLAVTCYTMQRDAALCYVMRVRTDSDFIRGSDFIFRICIFKNPPNSCPCLARVRGQDQGSVTHGWATETYPLHLQLQSSSS